MTIKEKKRIILISILGLISFILIMIGISYAYTLFTTEQKNPNVITSGCLKITLQEKNNISLSNTYPITDEEGKALTPYEFKVKNTCNLDAFYETSFVVDSMTDESNLGYIKVYLTGDSLVGPQILNTFNKAQISTVVSDNNYKIDEGYLKAGTEKTFYLNLWIDYDATVGGWNINGHIVLASTTTTIDDSVGPIIESFSSNDTGIQSLTATDPSGVSSVCINKSETNVDDCTWYRYTDNYTNTVTDATTATYYVHVKDIYGNMSSSGVGEFVDSTSPS